MNNEEDKDQLISKLKQVIINLIGWTYGGACNDCVMFREAPSCQSFIHEKDCGHLETINEALSLLGRPCEEGHSIQDPKAETQRLAQKRWEDFNNRNESKK